MLLIEPNETQFDLRWRMFGTYVRVHPMFWLLSAMLGFGYAQDPAPTGNGVLNLALWVLCCFVSILLHEFGHVWMGQLFGARPHIVLYSFGGLAIGANAHRRWQRILILLAGPGIQLLLWAALKYVVLPNAPLPRSPALLLFLFMMLSVNLYWPLLNLLPIFPLDGGQIAREVCEGIWGSAGLVISLWISLLLAAFLAVYALIGNNPDIVARLGLPIREAPWRYMPTGTFSAIMFGLLAYSSFQALQMENSRRRPWDDDFPWSR